MNTKKVFSKAVIRIFLRKQSVIETKPILETLNLEFKSTFCKKENICTVLLPD
jgi:hypothetical protein